MSGHSDRRVHIRWRYMRRRRRLGASIRTQPDILFFLLKNSFSFVLLDYRLNITRFKIKI